MEYLASLVLCDDVEEIGHIEIEDLAISIGCKQALEEWNYEFQMTVNDEYPPNSGFSSQKQLNKHIQEGKFLAVALQKELGAEYEITYVPIDANSLKEQ